MDTSLARVAYLLIRVTHPEVVIETGVAFGISTAFVLQALRENGSGGLHSVDLPPIVDLDGDLTGRAVPTYLRDAGSCIEDRLFACYLGCLVKSASWTSSSTTASTRDGIWRGS